MLLLPLHCHSLLLLPPRFLPPPLTLQCVPPWRCCSTSFCKSPPLSPCWPWTPSGWSRGAATAGPGAGGRGSRQGRAGRGWQGTLFCCTHTSEQCQPCTNRLLTSLSACLTCLPACRARGQPLYDSDEQQQEEALLDWRRQGEVADIQEEVQATYGHAYGGRQPGGCAMR